MQAVDTLTGLVRPVRDLARAEAFYTAVLGFTDAPGAAALHPLLAEAWDVVPGPCACLRLGECTLLLASCDSLAPAPDDGADDRRFQHFAIVVPDIAAAWARLSAAGPVHPIGRGGPQALPAASGGATAVKFRDPDGHPVEWLAFAGGNGPPAGIDHSAITVADADASIAFYATHMGLRCTARQVNHGPEQARLDGMTEPVVVDVVALKPAGGSPHLELLGYRPARPAAPRPAGPRTTTLWSAAGAPALRTDPDGHLHLLLPPSPGSP